MGRNLELHQTIGSTNDRARDLARAGAPTGTAVVAHTQTMGRGQHGRVWHSPANAGLYVSFIARPRLPLRRAPQLTLVAGLALKDAVSHTFGIQPLIRWPNDLIAPNRDPAFYGRKLAGVLVEASADPMRIDHAVIGIGVNLRTTALPSDLAAYAISVEDLLSSEEAGISIDSVRLLASIAREMERRLEQAEDHQFPKIMRDWSENAAGLGEHVMLHIDDEAVGGELEGVGEDGALLIRTKTELRTFYRGELHLKGAPSRPR